MIVSCTGHGCWLQIHVRRKAKDREIVWADKVEGRAKSENEKAICKLARTHLLAAPINK